MKTGTNVIIPHITYPHSGNPAKLVLKVVTVKGHRQTDGWTNPCQDYDYNLKLSDGSEAHWSHVFGIPEGVDPTPNLLQMICDECPSELLERSQRSALRIYVYGWLRHVRKYTLETLLDDVKGGMEVHVLVDNDDVGFYRDSQCAQEIPLEGVSGEIPREVLVTLLKQLGFKARTV